MKEGGESEAEGGKPGEKERRGRQPKGEAAGRRLGEGGRPGKGGRRRKREGEGGKLGERGRRKRKAKAGKG